MNSWWPHSSTKKVLTSLNLTLEQVHRNLGYSQLLTVVERFNGDPASLLWWFVEVDKQAIERGGNDANTCSQVYLGTSGQTKFVKSRPSLGSFSPTY